MEYQVEEALRVAGYPVADLAAAVDRKEAAVAGEDEQAGRSCDHTFLWPSPKDEA